MNSPRLIGSPGDSIMTTADWELSTVDDMLFGKSPSDEPMRFKHDGAPKMSFDTSTEITNEQPSSMIAFGTTNSVKDEPHEQPMPVEENATSPALGPVARTETKGEPIPQLRMSSSTSCGSRAWVTKRTDSRRTIGQGNRGCFLFCLSLSLSARLFIWLGFVHRMIRALYALLHYHINPLPMPDLLAASAGSSKLMHKMPPIPGHSPTTIPTKYTM